MPATDMKKTYRNLYAAVKKDPGFVTAPDLPYLMIDGEGDPITSAAFREGIEALYGLSYTLKFQLKKEGKDYTVMPLEGLFCAEDMTAFKEGRRNEWRWTLMIMQPKEVTEKRLALAEADLQKKRKLASPLPVRLEILREGLCAHVLHIGPYAEEGPTIERLHRFIEEEGCRFNGIHHEIYLSDPKRTPPAKMRTIIRQPVTGST
jgi:hypothetical protein